MAIRKIENIENERRGYETYDLGDGRRVDVSKSAVDRFGLEAVLRHHGCTFPTEPFPVYQSGKKVGTVPHWFDPSRIRSKSPLYDPRPGDFKQCEDGWIADKMLGVGDLTAIPGFIWDPVTE